MQTEEEVDGHRYIRRGGRRKAGSDQKRVGEKLMGSPQRKSTGGGGGGGGRGVGGRGHLKLEKQTRARLMGFCTRLLVVEVFTVVTRRFCRVACGLFSAWNRCAGDL